MSISALSQILVLYQKNVIWYDCCFAGTIIIHELIYTCDDCNPGASSITTTLLYVWKNLIFLSFFQIYLMRFHIHKCYYGGPKWFKFFDFSCYKLIWNIFVLITDSFVLITLAPQCYCMVICVIIENATFSKCYQIFCILAQIICFRTIGNQNSRELTNRKNSSLKIH